MIIFMTDLELMNIAKKRVAQRALFKLHIKIYLVAVIIFAAVASSGHLWPIFAILGWGLAAAFHGIGISLMLSGSCPTVTDEYGRLKTNYRRVK